MTKVLGLIGALLIASAGVASAHGTACCAGLPCPAGKVAVPGASPEEAQCCDPDGSNCVATPNAGWSCQTDPAANAQALPDRQAIAGCVDGEAGVCIGGAVSADGASGCVGLGVDFVVDMAPGATPEACTAAAVEACCAHGACVVAPVEE